MPVSTELPTDSPVSAAEVAPARLVPLRLCVTRGALGLELAEPVALGPLRVERLALGLPGLKYPVDLSGGVRSFRHRRGALGELTVGAALVELERWLAERWRGVLATLERGPELWWQEGALAVGLAERERALAFELRWIPEPHALRFVVQGARAVGFSGPALGHALRLLDSLGQGVRQGRIWSVEGSPRAIATELLPSLGVRTPAVAGVHPIALEVRGGQLLLKWERDAVPPEPDAAALRALELARLTVEADDALARAELDAARGGYLVALETAPRHPELVRLLAELDVATRAGTEAALGLLTESLPATASGLVGMELLAGLGDRDGALTALEFALQHERFAPLAALAWARWAELTTDLGERALALDRAVSACPASAHVRSARLALRAERGDIEGAVADGVHLEAGARGTQAKHAALRQAASVILAAGFVHQAGRMFERALRYVPEDIEATVGLAEALRATGKPGRAATLYARAVELAQAREQQAPAALLALAELCAERERDLPAAIARARQVPVGAKEELRARVLEGRWRALLGDEAGASLAFARLRDVVERGVGVTPELAVDALLEAARFEREVTGDRAATERHLAVALRLAPRSERVATAYRQAAAALAAQRRQVEPPVPSPEPSPCPPSAPGDAAAAQERVELTEAELAARAQALEAALRVRPDEPGLALELATLLTQLGRAEEAYALLAGRWEDGVTDPERRPTLTALCRLATRLRDDAPGSGAEAALYAEALVRWERELARA